MKAAIWVVMVLILIAATTAAPTITLQPSSLADNAQLNATLKQSKVLNLTVSPSSKIKYSLNGGSYTQLAANATAAATSPGAISFTEGDNTLRIVAIESNTSNASMDLDILVDTINPTADVSFSPSSTQPGQTNVILNWEFADDNFDSFWISLKDPNGDVLENKSVDEDDNHAIFAHTLIEGTYVADYQAVDIVGNKVKGNKTLQVANELAQVTLHEPSNATVRGEDHVELECSAADDNLSTITLYHNNDQNFGPEDEKNANSSQRIKFNLTNLDSEKFLWNCQAEDDFGEKTFAAENRTITIDDIKPSVSALSPTDGFGTLKKEVTFQWVARDNRNNTISCELWVNQTKKKETNLQDGDSVELKFNFGHGDHNWSVACEDEIGNIMHTTPRTFTIDLGLDKQEEEEEPEEEEEEEKEVPTPTVTTKEADDEPETKTIVRTQEVKLPSEEDQEPGILSRIAKAIGGRFTFKKSITIAAILMGITIIILGLLGVREYSKDNILFRVKVRKYKFMAKQFWERHIRRNKKYY